MVEFPRENWCPYHWSPRELFPFWGFMKTPFINLVLTLPVPWPWLSSLRPKRNNGPAYKLLASHALLRNLNRARHQPCLYNAKVSLKLSHPFERGQNSQFLRCFLPENTCSCSQALPSSAWHRSQSRVGRKEEKKNPKNRVHSLPFSASESDMLVKGSRGQTARDRVLYVWPDVLGR